MKFWISVEFQYSPNIIPLNPIESPYKTPLSPFKELQASANAGDPTILAKCAEFFMQHEQHDKVTHGDAAVQNRETFTHV